MSSEALVSIISLKTGAVGRRQLVKVDDADEASTLLVPSSRATTASALCGHRLLRHFL